MSIELALAPFPFGALTLPGSAGDHQRNQDHAELVGELARNYDAYHAFLSKMHAEAHATLAALELPKAGHDIGPLDPAGPGFQERLTRLVDAASQHQAALNLELIARAALLSKERGRPFSLDFARETGPLSDGERLLHRDEARGRRNERPARGLDPRDPSLWQG